VCGIPTTLAHSLFPEIGRSERSTRDNRFVHEAARSLVGPRQQRVVHILGPDARVEIELLDDEFGHTEVFGHLLDGFA